ncbi:hypothetical protein GCM10008905_23070 [Clostridium malenominatum]|uniref:Amidohydrolase-related domain-containing protein n=1 Tax=Clostridium malenominatum TaxID=1539 RepID=A0ABP3UC11_9CLOT
MNFKIVDSHVHFDVKGYEITTIREDYIEKYGEEKYKRIQQMNKYQSEKWREAWGFPEPLPTLDKIEDTAKLWIDEMEKNNIEKMIFLTGGGNETLSGIVKQYPDKFVGYAHHNPFIKNSPEILERAITEEGLKGYKILAPGLHGKLDDESLEPLWNKAEKHRIPILIHFGILGGAGGIANDYNINPMVLHDVIRSHPDIPFIIPHFGCGQTESLLQLAWVCPNVYVDTSGSNQWTRWMPYNLTVRDLFKKFYETIGPNRIIFGTDSQWFPRGFVKKYFDDQVKDCVELGMGKDEIKNIFRDNILNLLNLVK